MQMPSDEGCVGYSILVWPNYRCIKLVVEAGNISRLTHSVRGDGHKTKCQNAHKNYTIAIP